MTSKILFFLHSFLLTHFVVSAQVGIGTSLPNESAMLDVVSSDKGLLVPRLALLSLTDKETITGGNVESLLVYNFNSATTGLSLGYYYWSNNKWNRIATLDEISTGGLSVTNGLTILNSQIKLGGSLNEATEISTDGLNTLAISGLEESVSNLDRFIVVDPVTHVLKQKAVPNGIIRDEAVIVATNGQQSFPTPLPATDPNKIDVYRNGVRVDFVIIDEFTIELEPEAVCFSNDEVRIVQVL